MSNTEKPVEIHKWELLDEEEYDGGYEVTNRMKVPGGFLYKHMAAIASAKGEHLKMSMVFVPQELSQPGKIMATNGL